MCGLCVRPSARSGRKSSARIPASARAYDWICARSVWSGFERVGRDQIPEVPNKSNPSDPLIERINLTSPNRRRSLTLLSYSDLLSLHQFFSKDSEPCGSAYINKKKRIDLVYR